MLDHPSPREITLNNMIAEIYDRLTGTFVMLDAPKAGDHYWSCNLA